MLYCYLIYSCTDKPLGALYVSSFSIFHPAVQMNTFQLIKFHARKLTSWNERRDDFGGICEAIHLYSEMLYNSFLFRFVVQILIN